ncbi:MAG: hypothetical protein HY431_01910 [Candidatus Levybacteria bacterium]|nr:hypothetical protein [Candidatus Levybacteria bacterium]
MANKYSHGFTFIELILSISFVLILSVLAVPFYSRFFTQNDVANTADVLVGSLRKAQLYSMMGKQNGTWGVNYSSNTITLFQGSTFATRNSALDEKFRVNSAVTITGLTQLTFVRITGMPSATPTIAVSGNSNTKTITINRQGVVSK